jgi:hypothetical protein
LITTILPSRLIKTVVFFIAAIVSFFNSLPGLVTGISGYRQVHKRTLPFDLERDIQGLTLQAEVVRAKNTDIGDSRDEQYAKVAAARANVQAISLDVAPNGKLPSRRKRFLSAPSPTQEWHRTAAGTVTAAL